MTISRETLKAHHEAEEISGVALVGKILDEEKQPDGK